MGEAELVGKLTQVIAWQSGIIRELYSVVKQAELTTSLDGSVEAVQHEAERIINQQGRAACEQ